MKTRNSPLDILNSHKVKEGPFLMAHTTHGILEAMEEYAKQEAIEFVKWKDKLRIDEKITVHPPEGSNLPTGVYIMTNAQLYKAWKDEDNQ